MPSQKMSNSNASLYKENSDSEVFIILWAPPHPLAESKGILAEKGQPGMAGPASRKIKGLLSVPMSRAGPRSQIPFGNAFHETPFHGLPIAISFSILNANPSHRKFNSAGAVRYRQLSNKTRTDSGRVKAGSHPTTVHVGKYGNSVSKMR